MEGMVIDLSLAKENQNRYVEYLSIKGVARTGIDLNVTILTTGFWPTYKSFDLNLPSEMAFLLIFFSELGDKTFYIVALLAARNSSVVVFLGTLGALWARTLLLNFVWIEMN